jgi:hypothetical protein
MAKIVQLSSPAIMRTRMLANRYKTPEAQATYRKAVAEHLRSEAARLDREADQLTTT